MEISKTDKELRLFFNNSIFGAFFMMLDEPVTWNDQANKEELIEYILHHLRITRVNQAFLDQYSSEEKEMIGKTPFDFFQHDLDQEKGLLTNIFDYGTYRDISYEQKNDGTPVVFEGDYVVLYEDDDPRKRVTGVFGVQQEITKRIEHQENLQKALEEKELLLSEIHHRIKNNLSIISWLLNIQALESDNDVVKEKLTDSMFRIQTVAKIHDIIYHEKHFSEIDFSITLEKLIQSIKEVLLDGKSIDIHFDLNEVYLDMKHAIPFALIVNELVTNIFKHAFRGKENGKIIVHIYQKDEYIHFKIEDDGIGIPKDFNLKKSNSLGIQMIIMLSQQIKGEPVFDNNKPGTRFMLKFPVSG